MLRVRKVLMIFSLVLLGFTGCSRIDKSTLIDESGSDLAASTVKFVMLIDTPEGEDGRNAYLQWTDSIGPTLRTPEELLSVYFYENVEAGVSPDWLAAFEFQSVPDAITYMNRREIAAIFEASPARSTHTFIQEAATEAHDAPVISILLITYRPGGRDAYLQWAASVRETLIPSPHLRADATYENYYGESPHRLVELAFRSQADADAYEMLAERQVLVAELDTRAESWHRYTFQARSGFSRLVYPRDPGPHVPIVIDPVLYLD